MRENERKRKRGLSALCRLECLELSMPIRFRCAYCNQLMAIAQRKAGTVVRCPTCAGQVVVPSPEQAAAQESAAPPPSKPEAPKKPQAPALFERSDFGELFQNPAPPPPFALGPEPAGPGFDVAPLLPQGEILPVPPRRPRGLVLSPAMLILLLLFILVLLGLAFFIGMLVGRSVVENEMQTGQERRPEAPSRQFASKAPFGREPPASAATRRSSRHGSDEFTRSTTRGRSANCRACKRKPGKR
jgi:phage FluMu protein Com